MDKYYYTDFILGIWYYVFSLYLYEDAGILHKHRRTFLVFAAFYLSIFLLRRA